VEITLKKEVLWCQEPKDSLSAFKKSLDPREEEIALEPFAFGKIVWPGMVIKIRKQLAVGDRVVWTP
jgi:hypothetical protein